jgi:glycosyltransferase involved in cell wall biosynthesis
MDPVRVGVDYRILSVGKGLIRRGLGRFTQQQLRAVLAVDQANEYVLLCHPGADQSLVDPILRRAPNVSVAHLPGHLVPAIGDGWATRLQRSEQFQAWIGDSGIDLYHATTAFYPCEPMVSTFDVCPMVATFYDAIPLLFPSHYFLGPLDKSIYAFALSLLRSATRLLAISDASRQDAVDHVGVPRDRIDLAYPSVDGIFGRMPARDVDRMLARLSQRVRIPTQFAFTVSFPHHSKNLENLLRAYSLLPDDVRLRLPLVACCTIDEASAVVWPMARALGITDDLVLTGPVLDEELAALYNRATFVVHPSRYEGFGLPVAEAMRCGTPVVTTTSSSLPEIAGDAALLVDPDDVEGMAAAMLQVYESEALRRRMVDLGLVQSAKFTEDQLAVSTLECYRKALSPPVAPARRPRLAVWSPMPPDGGVSARTTSELLDELAPSVDVEVFVGDGAQPAFRTLGRRPVHHCSAFGRRHAQAAFDAVVYDVDATPAHAYVREPLRREPGIVVLHGASTTLDDVVGAGLAYVVHDPDVAASLARRHPDMRFVEVPLGVADPAESLALTRKTTRSELGCDDACFAVALVAPGSTEAAIESVTRAVARLAGEGADVFLLVAGATGVQLDRLRALAPRIGLADRLVVAPERDGDPVQEWVAASDVVVLLPTGSAAAGEAVAHARAAGRPVLRADAKVEGGLDTSAVLSELRTLHADRELLARRSAEARASYEERHTLARSAEAYLDVVAAVTGMTIERPPTEGRQAPDAWDEIVRVLG